MLYRYLTVDYDRGNFSVSQCVWNDGATPQVNALLAPSQDSPQPRHSMSRSKQIDSSAIAGATIAGVAILVLGGLASWYIIRRRQRKALQASADNVALTNFELDTPKYQGNFLSSCHSSDFVADQKLHNEAMTHQRLHRCQDSKELGTGGEIYQLPTEDNRDGDHMSLVSPIEVQKRVANNIRVTIRSIVFELQGSEPTPSEVDDE